MQHLTACLIGLRGGGFTRSPGTSALIWLLSVGLVTGCAPQAPDRSPLDATGEVIEKIDHEDGLAARGRCLEDRGWSITYEPGGGISMVSPPPEQEQAFNRDQYYCDAAYPFAQQDQSPEERQVAWYEYLNETYVPCVEELGFDVSPAPTLETFLAQGIESWVPNYEVGAQARAMGKAIAEVDEQCPQKMPTLPDD